MLPTISQITHLGSYRDGGSMSVSFLDDAGMEFMLMFPVKLGAPTFDGIAVLGYELPTLERYQYVDRVSPVTGVTHRDRKKMDSAQLEWEHARTILEKLRPLLIGYTSEYSYLFPLMQEIAGADGAQA